MKAIKVLFFLVIITQTLSAQKNAVVEYSAIDKKALDLPDSLTKSTSAISNYVTSNFNTDKEKVRAIYIWVASNIQYDIENMFAIDFYEKEEEKIAKPLRTRKGICENYASLFTDICLKAGLQSFVVSGYTKQSGFVDYIPHAWSAVYIDSSWFLFDPTWGSGYIDKGKFVKKIDNRYYSVHPSAFIRSHMPFDYLWQFLNYPVTNQSFFEGKIQPDTTKPLFNFKDSLLVYAKQSNKEKLVSSVYRVEKNGIKNSLEYDMLRHLKLEIEHENVDLYNSSLVDFNDGIISLNEYIIYRNQQFIPNKTDAEIQKMIDVAENKLQLARRKLGEIHTADSSTNNMISSVNKSIAEATIQVAEKKEWLKVYFSKNKLGRKFFMMKK